MAVILLQAAGAALGGIFGPVGAAIGQAAGALAGSLIDQSLIASTRTIRGRGLSGARIPSADEGAPIARVYGTMRIAGTLIWATRFEETVSRERQGGKGGPKVETYHYHGNFAVGLCEGPIGLVRRVWADGRELDLTTIEMRIHRGEASQMPDPLIEAKQGAGRAPAWRGLAYAVFERLPLDDFGNRIPMLQFEVVRAVGGLEQRIEAVAVIPGATEHGYAPTPVSERPRAGEKRWLNRNSKRADTDWTASIDEVQALCPNLKSVALVTAWMGTDLRAGHCEFHPSVEVSSRPRESRTWRVGNLTRATARRVGRIDGSPAYGGTPDDRAVIEAITDLKARGLEVVLYPFVLMDIVPGNGLPDPYGGAEQAALPWRGRLTCIPAPGRPGSPDGTVAIDAGIAALCGTAAPDDIHVADGAVGWRAGIDAGYRRMILHHAGLAQAAGGVDGFLIGSEMVGLTRLRNAEGGFPFVDALAALAADVKAMLGPATTVTYAADWSEYSGFRPDDGSGDVHFHLDPLWANPAIGAVGIDNYMPLSDWRDGDLDAGNPDGAVHANDRAALRAAIEGGEGFDWSYRDAGERADRLRTPIGDGLAGKDWVYRVKDIRGWWQNPHFDRVGGAERTEPTAWVPRSKPVWFTELGCPAVDKAAGQPNVFPDPKSAEGGLPHFSTGAHDDAAQRGFLSAHLDHCAGPANADGMVETGRIHLWAWDARPYPAFPARADLWADGGHWRTGHWLNGRLGTADLGELIGAILADAGFADFDVSGVDGAVSGYVAGDASSARALLAPLIDAFAIDVHEGPGGLVFVSRLRGGRAAEALAVIADPVDGPLAEETRAQESELANEAVIGFIDPDIDHGPASARSRRLSGPPNLRQWALPAALDAGLARRTADDWLRDHWAGRRRLSFALPPSRPDIEAGDIVRLTLAGAPGGRFRVLRVEDGVSRRVEAVGHVALPARDDGAAIDARASDAASFGFAPDLVLMDLPLITGQDETGWACAAGHVRPWRPLVVSSSVETEGFVERVRLDIPARMGTLAEALPPGRLEGVVDRSHALELDLDFGGLSSVSRAALLDGGNAAAVLSATGTWEVLQFEAATETAPGRWRLERLLRGQAGSGDAMRAGAEMGARFVLLDAAVRPLGLAADAAGLARNYVVDAAGQPPGEAEPQLFAGGLRALMPLAPAHPRARRDAAGIRVSWVRRDRIGADSWTPVEIGNAEGFERYRIEILSGGAVVRSAETEAPEWLYQTVDELADAGDGLTELTFRVSQAGRHVPWGIARTATVSL
ncbi:putative tail protein [Hoeflea marina]|uniref:Putative tail protein n=1 Tax=Hoeflea marina TaxID=274592 RepID=A0A317PMU9_9HYPH|nr:glycoside hydrolase/phage tail family protein [Hoeflea marina]PWW02222.1 putative tail protein [Hoeflea marina]